MELTITIIGTITAIITVVLTNYFVKRNKLKFSERKLKENYYLEYIKCISNNANYNDEQSVLEENKAFNTLVLIASEDVLYRLYEFQNLRIDKIKNNKVNNYIEKYDRLFTELIKSIRKDLYGKKAKNIPNIYILSGIIGDLNTINK